MTYAGVSIGKTKSNKYKAYCLVSKDGSTSPEGNNLRAIAFKDQPVRGFPKAGELLDHICTITPKTLQDYIGGDRAESKGVHLGTQDTKDVYVHSILEWNSRPPKGPGERRVGWHVPMEPQLQFNFNYD